MAVVPKVAAGCSPEVTLISIHRATPPWAEDRKGYRKSNHRPTAAKGEQTLQPGGFLPDGEPSLLCDREAGLQRDRDDLLGAPVGIPHN